jgi:hypothetical protein
MEGRGYDVRGMKMMQGMMGGKGLTFHGIVVYIDRGDLLTEKGGNGVLRNTFIGDN